MAYNNRMPVLSRIDKGVRDNDFIPISELKEFDNKIAQIVKLFESAQNTDVNDANSLAKKMKDIEYHMADALVFDDDGNIIGYNTNPENPSEPLYGEDAMYEMLERLEEYYGNFVALMGSDPNIDNWKIDLNNYYTEAVTLFKNKLTGVFKNSALAATLEAKNDKISDYVLNDNVSLKKGQIMRLNPDLQSYLRNISLLPSEQNVNFIAFEVTELEKNSLALNLKIQNGFMWVNLNIVLDNGKWFVSREKVLGKDINDNIFKINIFKYTSGDNTKYVFCLYTDYPELDQQYNFEIEGLLINGYSFNATGLAIDKHNKYYSYKLVEDTSVDPLYNEIYYTKSVENYGETGEENTVLEAREIYVPHEKLLKFEEGVEYYTRSTNFVLVHGFDFIHDELDGDIDKNDVLKEKRSQLVVEDVKYHGESKALKVDYEVSEVFDDNEELDPNDYINNHKKLRVDDSVRLFNNGMNLISVGKSPKKINDHVAAAYGEEAFDVVDLRPGEIVNTNAHLSRDASDKVYNDIHGNLTKLEDGTVMETVFKINSEFYEDNLFTFNNGNMVYIDLGDGARNHDGTGTGNVYFKDKGWEKETLIADNFKKINHLSMSMSGKYIDFLLVTDEFIVVSIICYKDFTPETPTTGSSRLSFYAGNINENIFILDKYSNLYKLDVINDSFVEVSCIYDKEEDVLYFLYKIPPIFPTYTSINNPNPSTIKTNYLNITEYSIVKIKRNKLTNLFQHDAQYKRFPSYYRNVESGLENMYLEVLGAPRLKPICLTIDKTNSKKVLNVVTLYDIYFGESKYGLKPLEDPIFDEIIEYGYIDLDVFNINLDENYDEYEAFEVYKPLIRNQNGAQIINSEWHIEGFDFIDLRNFIDYRKKDDLYSVYIIKASRYSDNYSIDEQKPLILITDNTQFSSPEIFGDGITYQELVGIENYIWRNGNNAHEFGTIPKDFSRRILTFKLSDNDIFISFANSNISSNSILLRFTYDENSGEFIKKILTLPNEMINFTYIDLKQINGLIYVIPYTYNNVRDIITVGPCFIYNEQDDTFSTLSTYDNQNINNIKAIENYEWDDNLSKIVKKDDKIIFINETENNDSMVPTISKAYIRDDYYSSVPLIYGETKTRYNKVDTSITPEPGKYVRYFRIESSDGRYVLAGIGGKDFDHFDPNIDYYTREEYYEEIQTTPDPDKTYYTKNENDEYIEHLPGSLTEWGSKYVDCSKYPEEYYESSQPFYTKISDTEYIQVSHSLEFYEIAGYEPIDKSITPNPEQNTNYYTFSVGDNRFFLEENLTSFDENTTYYKISNIKYYQKQPEEYFEKFSNEIVPLFSDNIFNDSNFIDIQIVKHEIDNNISSVRYYIETKDAIYWFDINENNKKLSILTENNKISIIDSVTEYILSDFNSIHYPFNYRHHRDYNTKFIVNPYKDDRDILYIEYQKVDENDHEISIPCVKCFLIDTKPNFNLKLVLYRYLENEENYYSFIKTKSKYFFNIIGVETLELNEKTEQFEEIFSNKYISNILGPNDEILFIQFTDYRISEGEFYINSHSGGTILEEFKYMYGADFYNINTTANPHVYDGDKIRLSRNECYKIDLIEDPSILDNLVQSDDPVLSKKLSNINDYIKNNLVFNEYFECGILKRSENTVDIIIIPDKADIANGDFFMLFTVNISSDIMEENSTEKALMYRALTKTEDEFINRKFLYQRKWSSICSNQLITLAIGNDGLFYSYNSDVFHRLINPVTENTHEPIIFDDSFEVFYDNVKYFYIVKADKTSTDHTFYYSENGIIWKKSNMDILFPSLTGESYYPKIYVTGINRTWFVGGKYGTLMLDNVGLEHLVSKYTELVVNETTVQFSDPSHTYNPGFNCTDIFFNGTYYYALDITNGELKYASPTSNSTSITKYIASWNTINIDQAFTEPRIYDFKLYGHDLRGMILYGSGRNDPTTAGIWYSLWNSPGTFTKSTSFPQNVLIYEFYPCVSIWKNDNGSETTKDFIYVIGSDEKTYRSEDFGQNWEEEYGTHEVLQVGSYNNYFIIKNTNSGIVAGTTFDGYNGIQSDFTTKLTKPKACISRILHETVGYNVIHVTDNNSGKILFTTDLLHWYPTSVIGYNPITELQDSGNLVVGNTTMYPIALNKDYDESYCSSRDTNRHKTKYINNDAIYIKNNDDGLIDLHINDEIVTIEGSEGINPNDFLIFTLSNSKIRYCMISELNKGIWISDELNLGTFSGKLQHISLDIYVENGFQNGSGLFIYGKDDNDKTKLYFLSTRDLNLENFEFEEKLVTDYIDYIKPHNNDIIISTYDIESPYDKYSYKSETNEFIRSSAIDITDVYSFNNTFEYNGDIYFINGSGSNPTIRNTVDNNEGVFRIRKSLDSLGNIEYDITPIIKSNKIYENISTIDKIYTGVLQVEKDRFILVTSGKDSVNNTFITNKFIIDFSAINNEDKFKIIENIDRYNNPLIYDINNIIESEEEHARHIIEQDRRDSAINIPSYGLIVQRHSFDCNINNLEEKNLVLKNKVDDYYFDKPTKTLKFSTYGISGKSDFKLNSEKISFATTINDGKSAIVIALGQNNAFGVFDKDNGCIKVVETNYIDRTTGQELPIKLDPEYNNLQSVIIGKNNTELRVYGLFYGKFPQFSYTIDTNERYLDYSKSVTVYKVFSIDYNSLKNAGDSISVIEEKNFTYDPATNTIRSELKNYIREQNFIPSEDLNLTDTELQIIAISENIVYNHTYSLIVWNSKKKCLEAYTKYQYDTSLDNPNEKSNVNQKISSNIEGADFERDSLYIDIADPVEERTTMKLLKVGDNPDNFIETKLFVANLTNRKNLFITGINDYKKDLLFDPSRYLKYMQTRYGVFRFISEDCVIAVNKRLNTTFTFDETKFNQVENAPASYRNVESMFYYTPEGTNSIIPIHIGNKGCVTDIWETYEGLFIQTKEFIEYLYDEQEVYKLYKLEMIPESNRSDLISIHDTRFFREMDTKYARIYDMCDSLQGLVCVGTEPKGISDPNNGVNNDIYTGNTYVFWYNGDDFIVSKTFSLNNTSSWVKFKYIINTPTVPLLIASEQKQIWKYIKSTNSVERETTYDTIENNSASLSFLDCLDAYVRSQKYEANYPRPINDIMNNDNVLYVQGVNENNIGHLFKINLTEKTMDIIKEYGEVDRDIFIYAKNTQGLIRYPIVRPSDNTRQYNLDLIENILSQGIPVDKTLKVIGSLICDGVRFNVSAMHIETHTGVNNKEFKTLVFNIDKHFRSDLSREIFTETPGTIRFGFGEIDKNIQKMNIIIFY